MNTERFFLLFLGLFLILYGIANATNIEVVWMHVICALAALVAGSLCLFRVFLNGGWK